jgi:CRP/FNR family transcriptional regulator, cyclic AMP receptor protein
MVNFQGNCCSFIEVLLLMIPIELVYKYGGHEIKLGKDEVLFREGDKPLFYYEIVAGSIKMVNYSQDGQEFIQGIFEDNESFGEPPLFADFKYPSAAIAIKDTVLLKLRKDFFFNLLKDHFDIHLKFTQVFSKRLKYKSMILREISSYAPDHRVLTLINYFKTQSGTPKHEKFLVPYTRQQIADMTGLRVETVIRTVSRLKEEGKISVIKHKIYLN